MARNLKPGFEGLEMLRPHPTLEAGPESRAPYACKCCITDEPPRHTPAKEIDRVSEDLCQANGGHML